MAARNGRGHQCGQLLVKRGAIGIVSLSLSHQMTKALRLLMFNDPKPRLVAHELGQIRAAWNRVQL